MSFKKYDRSVYVLPGTCEVNMYQMGIYIWINCIVD